MHIRLHTHAHQNMSKRIQHQYLLVERGKKQNGVENYTRGTHTQRVRERKTYLYMERERER